MAELLALLGGLAGLQVAFAAMIVAWRRLLPGSVERARLRVEHTPWQCFGLGLLAAALLLPPIACMLALPLVFTRIVGCYLLLTLIALSSLGAAGVATRTTGLSASRSLLVELAALIWMGGVATVILFPAAAFLMQLPLELAWPTVWSIVFLVALCALLVIARKDMRVGRFIVLPIAFLPALGAVLFALLRWMPKPAKAMPRGSPGAKAILIPALILVWLLPIAVICVSIVAFLVRGGVAIELAADLPFVAWLAIVSAWAVTVVAGTALAFSRWGRWWKRPLPSGGSE